MVRHLRTLGTLALYEQGDAAREDAEPLLSHSKSLALLAYVALAPGREASRGHLARLLWPEAGRTRARRSLRQALYYLSKRAGGELLRAEDDAVSVAEEALEVDAWAFERALREDRLEEAVDLYGGEFLGGFGGRAGREFESWIEAQNERIWSGLKAAYHELVNRSIERDDIEGAVRFGRAYVDLNPFDEAAQSTLVGALLARGDRVAAYQQYESFRTLLEEELDEEPEPGLTDRIEELQAEIFSSRDVDELGVGPRKPASATGASGRPASEELAEESTDLFAPGPFRWALTGALAATLVFALVAAVQWLPADEPAGPPGWEGADGTLRIRHGPDSRRISEVRIRDGVAEVRPTELSHRALPSPAGNLLAEEVVTDSGPDLVVRDRETGAVLATAARRADESVLAWAPDGSRVLFDRSERLDQDRLYLKRLHVLRVDEGTVERLEDLAAYRYRSWAVWSPRGGRIAWVGSGEGDDPDVFVADADGGHARNLTRHPAADDTPAWSPDGRRIAFASDRAGDMDLYLAPATGGQPERITFGPEDEVAPHWLDEDRIAFRRREADGSGELWLLDLTSRNTRGVAGPFENLKVDRFRDDVARGRWVERLVVEGGDVRWVVGQRHRLWTRAEAPAGRPLPPEEIPVRWRSLTPGVVRVDSTGEIEGRRLGSGRVVASYGGWRADTVRVTVGSVSERSGLRPLLLEDWSDGIDERRWLLFGEPAPELVPARRDGSGTALDPNGDENYASGIVLRDGIVPRGGLTLEVAVRFPLTGQLYQAFRVGFHADADAPERGWHRSGPGVAGFRLGGDRVSHELAIDGRRVGVQKPSEPGDRHVYALQIEPDGRVSYARDGSLVWRSGGPVLTDLDRELRLRLAGRSLHTRLAIDEVRLWRGVRYVVGDPSERDFRIAPRRNRGSDEPSGS